MYQNYFNNVVFIEYVFASHICLYGSDLRHDDCVLNCLNLLVCSPEFWSAPSCMQATVLINV